MATTVDTCLDGRRPRHAAIHRPLAPTDGSDAHAMSLEEKPSASAKSIHQLLPARKRHVHKLGRRAKKKSDMLLALAY